MIKKLSAAATLCMAGFVLHAQTLIHYGNHTISKDEFLRAFNKNNTSTGADKVAAIKEYITLYSNFKLKVKAAREIRLDTLAQVQNDVSNFRKQIIENYLNNDKGVDKLCKEAFNRYQTDLHVIHYSVPVPAGPDSAKAFKTIQELYNQLQANNNEQEAYQKVAGMDAALRSSDFGFVTAFTLPYQYENMVYALQPGQSCKPYRSKTAWHIFKVKETRPSIGRWRIAQILVGIPEHADATMQDAAKERALQIYQQLKQGEAFATIAREKSDDRSSSFVGGELPEFTSGTYSPAFEENVFSLKNDGDLTAPFRTAFGYHIVKRIAHRPTPTTVANEIFMNDLKQQVLKDDRMNTEKALFSQQLMVTTGLKPVPDVKEKELFQYADSLLMSPAEEQVKRYSIYAKKIVQFKKGFTHGSDWLQFVQNIRSTGVVASNRELWQKYLPYAALNYYKEHLEAYNPEFAFQMNEFEEGNLLFEIMERNVWSKASNDNAALQQYYKAHKANYQWAPSADVLIFNCSSPKLAEETLVEIKKGKDWKAIAAFSNNNVQADSGRYELSQIVGANQVSLPVKDSYSAIASNIDGTSTFVKYVNIYPRQQQRSFEEARGLVINDYQQELERRWIAQLRKKYPVRVNENLLKQLLK